MITLAVLSLLIYIACGILAYGFALGYYQRQYPSIAKKSGPEDIGTARMAAFFGPVGLLSIFLLNHTRHGLMFRLPRDQ